jgi:hypothetical protein
VTMKGRSRFCGLEVVCSVALSVSMECASLHLLFVSRSRNIALLDTLPGNRR